MAPRTKLFIDPGYRCVEPNRRLVGGRFCWAVHRFPIRGGITIMQATRISATEAITRPSYFARLFSTQEPKP